MSPLAKWEPTCKYRQLAEILKFKDHGGVYKCPACGRIMTETENRIAKWMRAPREDRPTFYNTWQDAQ